MKVLVIGGGISSEREISLQSSAAVFEAVKNKGHQAVFYDWDGKEAWLLRHAAEFDAALPILHGAGGEDGQIQHILEKLNVPYLGSDARVSEMCFDKVKTQDYLQKNGFTIPLSKIVTLKQYMDDPLFNKPHVLKPQNGGSSIDTFIYPDPDSKDIKAITRAFGNHSTMLLQQFVQGVEITVGVLEGMVLTVAEIIPPQQGGFNYENKYNGKTKEIVPAQTISSSLQKRAQQLGKDVHELLACRHLSRVDMIVVDERFFILEVNTLPGMTSQSLYPKMVAAAGLNFEDFVHKLIEMVVENHEK